LSREELVLAWRSAGRPSEVSDPFMVEFRRRFWEDVEDRVKGVPPANYAPPPLTQKQVAYHIRRRKAAGRRKR